jgi:formylglycine-generating enzyme required for sulfatase activity
VTVEQYAACYNGGSGSCTAPDTGRYCNWEKAGGKVVMKPGREKHPANCVNWEQAKQFAGFQHARLPSESEYEYAERSQGKSRKYPWGDDVVTCDRAAIYGNAVYDYHGCSRDGTIPVCSKPAGNTAQGLCDMVGDVLEWVEDKYQSSVAVAPTDGGAVESGDDARVLRGYSDDDPYETYMKANNRGPGDPGSRYYRFGFRLARSAP